MGATLEFNAKAAEPALAALSAALQALWSEQCGRDLGLKIASPEILEDAAARALLPPEASAFGLNANGTAGLLVLIDRAGLLALASLALGLEDEAITARQTSADDYSPEEVAALEKLASGSQGLLKAALTGSYEARALDHLKEAVWASGSDPLDGRELVVSRITISMAGLAAAEALLLMSVEVGAELKVAAGPSSTAAAVDLNSLLFLGAASEFGAQVLATAGGSLTAVDDVAALVKDFSAGSASGALIAVARGEEHMLATIASLRDYPGCDTKVIVVALEDATAWNVVRCGRLGLFSVLGPDFEAQDLIKRLESQSS